MHRQELAYAAAHLNSIEINGSFYALQKPASFQLWAAQTPESFVFSVKGGRFITHMKKLRDVEVPLANFLGSGVLALGAKLGPLLWQLPPNLGFDAGRMDAFLARLPHTTQAAAELAAGHDDRIKDRSWVTTDADRPLRHAVEVRHETFRSPAFLDLLRRYGVALVVADTAGKWPQMFDVTADFVYVRLHGAEELYTSGYDEAGLEAWGNRVREWASAGRDVYVYFDNDVKVRAPYDAMALAARLGVS